MTRDGRSWPRSADSLRTEYRKATTPPSPACCSLSHRSNQADSRVSELSGAAPERLLAHDCEEPLGSGFGSRNPSHSLAPALPVADSDLRAPALARAEPDAPAAVASSLSRNRSAASLSWPGSIQIVPTGPEKHSVGQPHRAAQRKIVSPLTPASRPSNSAENNPLPAGGIQPPDWPLTMCAIWV